MRRAIWKLRVWIMALGVALAGLAGAMLSGVTVAQNQYRSRALARRHPASFTPVADAWRPAVVNIELDCG